MKVKSNWVDNMVGYFSPEAGYRRLQYRRAQATVRSYEGASAGRRTGGWISTGNGSANAEIGPAIHRVRERVRDLVRNNPYAGRAISVIESNTIGTGILGGIVMPPGQEKASQKLGGLWKDWCESTDCDADGIHDFYGLQAMAMRSVAEGGECLVVRKWRRMSDGYKIPVPFQIQLLEGDYIDTARDFFVLDNGNYIFQGIEFNKRGQRVAYYLFNQHPGEPMLSPRATLLSSRVDAKDVLHLFRADRVGQHRGISWGAPCVIRMHDFDQYEDAQLLRQKIAACFAGFIRDIEMPGDLTGQKATFDSQIQAGTMELLPPGKTIEFPNLPTVTNDGHAERVLRSIAMGFGVTYEALTGDLSGVNFSSGRMGWIEFDRNVQKWRWTMFVPRFSKPVFSWFLEAADMVGAPTQGASMLWTPPRREMIDPTKEIPAQRDAVRAGITSLSEVIRENGRVPEELFAEIKRDYDTLDKLGLKLDSDPRYLARGGNAQVVPGDQGGVDGSQDQGA